jgi:hypothetical protein
MKPSFEKSKSLGQPGVSISCHIQWESSFGIVHVWISGDTVASMDGCISSRVGCQGEEVEKTACDGELDSPALGPR